MTRTASGSTAATSVASGSETKHNSITALCALHIPTIKIGPQEDLFIAINNIQQGAFLTKITGITLEKFHQWNESESRRGRLFFYSSEYKVLIIKCPLSGIHEYLSNGLGHHITRGLSENLYNEIKPLGSRQFSMIQGGNLTAAGRPDGSLALADTEKNNGWPPVIIEVGWSQNRTALIAKAHWWFRVSNNAIKIVLLIKATPLQIQIEKWKTSPLPDSSAARRPITRLYQREAANEYPRIHPPILTISRASASTPPNEYRVTGTPLRLEFRDVFLRNPVPPEGDILVEERFLRRYAENAWQEILRRT
ncbi:unnamed protein product [Clonostachys rosea f. rosea IK726]|uniref:Uncharacterized protein n=1 Tax=Clonostachys rosea f. rosea IK726 TaxID=1349383 RepID=A0ACA9TQ98_BIOOC|nr:unnamed protein product [Clonostachys rosea f. rosea IK726]